MNTLNPERLLCYLFWFITITKPIYYIIDIPSRTISLVLSVILLFIAFILINLQMLRTPKYYWNNVDTYLLIYGVWAFLTIFFPESESNPIDAVGNAVLFLLTLLVASITLNYHESRSYGSVLRNSLNLLSLIRLCSLIVVVTGILVYGSNMADRAEVVAGLSPAVLGLYSSLVIIISLSFLHRTRGLKRLFDLIAVIVCLLCLIFSIPKGSIVALFLSLFFSFILFWKQLRLRYFLFLIGCMSILILNYFDYVYDYFIDYIMPRNPYIDHLTTLTGRTHLWSVIFENYLNNVNRLLFGFGYHSFSELFSDRRSFITGAGQSHNATIELIFETGIIGLLLFMVSIGLAVRKIIRIWLTGNNDIQINIFLSIIIMIMIFMLIRGVTEAGYGSASSIDHFLMVLIIIMITVYYDAFKKSLSFKSQSVI